jgi:urease accessory protein UreH
MNTLSDGTTTITLDDSLMWLDRQAWQPVQQTVDRTLTGALIVQQFSAVAGRPVTLGNAETDQGWMRLADVQRCQAWAATLGQVLTLSWLGETYSVIWRAHEQAIDAQPLWALTDEHPDDEYVVTLRLMTV